MTNEQAREILSLHRPGTDDAQEPDVARALDAARTDPELGRWLERHRATQSAFRAGLRQIPVPEGLREQIVSEVKAHIRARRRTRVLLATAAVAACAVLVGVAVLLPRSGSTVTFENFRTRMVKTALRGYNMDVETNDLSQIRRHLAASQAHGDAVLPAGLEAMTRSQAILPTGCAVLRWQDEPVSMLCFADQQRRPLWLFVINRTALPDPPTEAAPRREQVNTLATASWSRGGKTYILAGKLDQATLERCL